MRTSRIIPAAFVASALSGPAHAAPTCLLEVAGQRYIDGPCDAFRTSDGHLIISVGGGSSISYWAMVRLQGSDDGVAIWSGTLPEHTEEHLGPMQREGSCWIGAHARICAWGAR
jgi:hypothetical protein